MSLPFDRELLAHLVIATAICIGAWAFYVQPKSAELQMLEASAAGQESQPFGGEISGAQFAQRLETLKARTNSVDQRNTFAQDSSGLYRLVMTLARENGVTVQSLQPGLTRVTFEDDSVSVLPFDVTVEGDFEAVASFLDAIDETRGFITSTSFALIPAEVEGTSVVQARFGFAAVAYDLSEIITKLAGASDVVE